MANDNTRFDIGALRALAGEKVFARGAEYRRDGLVEILALEPGRILAQVSGNEDYRTVVNRARHADWRLMLLPAIEDWGFCKHIVAVALAANAMGGDVEEEGAGALSSIRDRLKTKSVDELVVSPSRTWACFASSTWPWQPFTRTTRSSKRAFAKPSTARRAPELCRISRRRRLGGGSGLRTRCPRRTRLRQARRRHPEACEPLPRAVRAGN
jgi:hypothetical protein